MSERRRVKAILVEEHGGQCRLCGYSRCVANLDFHHVYPEIKEFGLSHKGLTISIDRARHEAAKCLLVCKLCHTEVEEGITPIGSNILREVHERMRARGIEIPSIDPR